MNMKTHQTICELLGLKQQEIAMLLGVHRTQWSMFELGKRSLPKEALMQLHEILSLNQSADTMLSKETPANQQTANFSKEELETLLKENEYQLLATERKLNNRHQKLQSLLRVQLMVNQLQVASNQNSAQRTGVLQMIEKRVQKSLENNTQKEINILERKMKLLQLEYSILKTEYKKLVETNNT